MLYFFAAAALSSGVFGYGPGRLSFDKPEAERAINAYVKSRQSKLAGSKKEI